MDASSCVWVLEREVATQIGAAAKWDDLVVVVVGVALRALALQIHEEAEFEDVAVELYQRYLSNQLERLVAVWNVRECAMNF